MGSRGQVYMRDTGVYLYTHWSADELVEKVRAALSKRWRWDDPEYLTRIVFCQMVRAVEDLETGYGIGTHLHDDIWRLVELDCSEERVRVFDVGLDDKERKCVLERSFEDFVNGA